jgi:membrane protein required for colicin V production
MYLDLIIAVLILWGILRGFKRGLIIELCTLMALVLGIYGAATFGDMGSAYLQSEFNTDKRLSLVLAFAVLFVIIVVAVFIFGKILEGLIKMVALGLVNKIFGALFGALKFALILSGILFVLEGFELTATMIPSDWKSSSYFYGPISSLATELYPVLKDASWLDSIKEGVEELKEKVS